MKNRNYRNGFTLVEILVAMTVTGLLLTGIMAFYLQNVRTMYASDQRMKLAGQIKKFSNELMVNASRANQFVLFKSAQPTDFDATDGTDRQEILVDDPLDPPLHPAGDFAVFVYYEIPKPAAQARYRIQKIEGYFLTTPTAAGIGPVTKVLVDLTATPSTDSIEEILAAQWTSAVFSTYIPLARGLSTPEVIDDLPVGAGVPTVPRLFYMSDARNVIISGQLYSSNKDIATGDLKTYTNSFFFNITPRT